MKTTLLLACLGMLCLTACQRDLKELPIKPEADNFSSKNGENGVLGLNTPTNSAYCTSGGAYQICLLKSNYPGNPGQYIWEWKFTNTNPGNGNGGTFQGLSHWSFNPGACIETSNIISSAYSTNGTSWYSLGTSIGPDPSNTCTSGQTRLFKFDFGTNGSAPTYYRIILNKQVGMGLNTAYYKSGKKTPCGSFQFYGFLQNNPGCSTNFTVVGMQGPFIGE